MWEDIYGFLERYSGVSYNFDEDLQKISGYYAFSNPYDWKVSIDLIIDNLTDALDVIDDFGDNMVDTLPGKVAVAKFVTRSVIGEIVSNINNVKKNLELDTENINNIDTLQSHVELLYELIKMFVENNIDDITKHSMFDKLDESNDEDLSEKLNIHKKDIPNMWFNVQSILETIASEEEEDDD